MMMRRPLLLLAIVGAIIAAAAAPAHAATTADCRAGSQHCPSGCCNSWCPTGSWGAAINGPTPLQSSIVGLTYHKSKLLLTGTIVVTNTGTAPVSGVLVGFSAKTSPTADTGNGFGEIWCGGARAQPLPAGASIACPIAIVGGLDTQAYTGFDLTPNTALPGVNKAAWQEARAFSTSEVVQTDMFNAETQPWVETQVRNSWAFPQAGSTSGFACGFAPVRAKVVA
jgi:hypothetical protein